MEFNQKGPISFIVENRVIAKREDFKVLNSRGHNLECSYFEAVQIQDKPHPCVLYLHGNSSSRNEGIFLIQYLIPYGISLVLMDFSGCGISEGEYISLGFYEKQDAKQVMAHVRNWKNITEFGLWGRSMGAATTLMTALQEDPSIRYIVVDSSFLSIKQVCQEIAASSYKVPQFILNWAYMYIRKKVKDKAKFNLDDCDTLEAVRNAKNKPAALFLVAKNDTLILPYHSQRLYDAFRGSKRILQFEGTHNSRRPKEINQEITKFFFNGLFDSFAMNTLKAFKMVPNLQPVQFPIRHEANKLAPGNTYEQSTLPKTNLLQNIQNIQNKQKQQQDIGRQQIISGQLKIKDFSDKDEIHPEDDEVQFKTPNIVIKLSQRQQENSRQKEQIIPQQVEGQQSHQEEQKESNLTRQIQKLDGYYKKDISNNCIKQEQRKQSWNDKTTTHLQEERMNEIEIVQIQKIREDDPFQGQTRMNGDEKIKDSQLTQEKQDTQRSRKKQKQGEEYRRDDVNSEYSKTESVNMGGQACIFLGGANIEGFEGSPRIPKSQINLDSNNILINSQYTQNNNYNIPSSFNGHGMGVYNSGQNANSISIMQMNINKGNVKEEEELTQVYSKIEKIDFDHMSNHNGMSGFFIPQDTFHQSQAFPNIPNSSPHNNYTLPLPENTVFGVNSPQRPSTSSKFTSQFYLIFIWQSNSA